MYRIIGGDGREYGPVPPAQIEQWIAQNRANTATRIRPEGTAEWLTLADLPEFAPLFAARCAPPPLPAADLPPPAAPDLAAAASAPTAPTPAEIPADPVAAAHAVVGRSYDLSVLDTLSAAWTLISRRFLTTVAAATVVVVTSGLLSAIPYVGIASTFLLQLVFLAGGYWVMLQVDRGQEVSSADAFAGFRRAFRPLVVLTLTATLALRVLALVALGPLLWQLFGHGTLSSADLAQIAFGADPFSELFALLVAEKRALPALGSLVGPLALLPVLGLPLLYFSVAWIFAPLLVIDRGVAPLAALTLSRRVAHRRWFRLLLLNLAFFPLALAGLLFFFVGIFVAAALAFAAFAIVYETAFAGRPAERDRAARD